YLALRCCFSYNPWSPRCCSRSSAAPPRSGTHPWSFFRPCCCSATSTPTQPPDGLEANASPSSTSSSCSARYSCCPSSSAPHQTRAYLKPPSDGFYSHLYSRSDGRFSSSPPPHHFCKPGFPKPITHTPPI